MMLDRFDRLSRALIGFAVLGLLVAVTISDRKIQAVTLAILTMFALRSWVHSRRMVEREEEATEELRRE